MKRAGAKYKKMSIEELETSDYLRGDVTMADKITVWAIVITPIVIFTAILMIIF